MQPLNKDTLAAFADELDRYAASADTSAGQCSDSFTEQLHRRSWMARANEARGIADDLRARFGLRQPAGRVSVEG